MAEKEGKGLEWPEQRRRGVRAVLVAPPRFGSSWRLLVLRFKRNKAKRCMLELFEEDPRVLPNPISALCLLLIGAKYTGLPEWKRIPRLSSQIFVSSLSLVLFVVYILLLFVIL